MNRRTFVSKSGVLTAGYLVAGKVLIFPGSSFQITNRQSGPDLYELFINPGLSYHPYVRWWWNGNKVEAEELVRELRLLKDAGIGGVEINPVEFPTRFVGDDLGKPSLKWLSDEWIDMLMVTFEEAKSLGMTCDLIVGSGWPFGAEYLEGEERSQIVAIGVKKLIGPLEYEISSYELFKEADPAISSPFPGRTMELLSLNLVPDPMTSIDQVIDLSSQTGNEVIKVSVPKGKHALYGLVKVHGFMQVINGAPGATGPVLNHYNEAAIMRHVEYMTLVWEAINKNGSGCDYVSKRVIRNSEMKNGHMHYGPRKYHTLFLIQVDSLETTTAKKLNDFVEAGGRIFCIETYPGKSSGWKNYVKRDKEVLDYVEKMKAFPDRFIFLKKPEKDFIIWYQGVQKQYGIEPYVKIEKPDLYVMQNLYQADDGSEMLFIVNSHIHNSHQTKITFSKKITNKKQGWIWDLESGKRYRISLAKDNSINLDIGPADSMLFVFDKQKNGPEWDPLPTGSPSEKMIQNGWSAEFIHCRDGSVKTVQTDTLQDLKEIPDFVHFSGTVIYRNKIKIDDPKTAFLNLGKVYGISGLKVNGKDCGVKWYGLRIYLIAEFLTSGANTIEIKVVTTMGNYMKSLTDNPIAQYWTNEKTKNQPLQSMGLIGPVTLY